MRVGLALLAVAVASFPAAGAFAQEAEAPPPVVLEPAPPEPVPVPTPAAAAAAEWPSSASPPAASYRPQRVHSEDVGRMVLGGILFGLGYASAVVWGSYVLASLPLGSLSCNDPYGGWMLLPAVGPAIGLGVASGCISLGFEEVLLPVLMTLLEVAGAAWFLGGLAGNTDEIGRAHV